MTNLIDHPKPVRNLTQGEILAIELGLRTPEQQRRVAALNWLAKLDEEAQHYYEYINSPEWRAKADAAKARAGHRCQVCNSPHRLEAHHRCYDRLGHEDEMDITVLCDVCHGLFHEHKRLSR